MEASKRGAHVEAAVLEVVRSLADAKCEAETPLMQAGIDSLGSTELTKKLSTLSGLRLSPTLTFDQPTPRAVAAHILEELPGATGNGGATVGPTVGPAAGQIGNAISTVGIAGACGKWAGGADSHTNRAKLHQASADALGEVPAKRWDIKQAVDYKALTPTQAQCVRFGGFMLGAEVFDARAFALSPSEVNAMDPQQRLLLDHAYQALHSTAHRRGPLLGGDGGVFLGIEHPDWALAQPPSARASVYAVTGDNVSVCAGRVSFALGMQGPCSSIDTACASSLSACQAAAHAVKAGDCLAATTMAVALKLHPKPTLAAAAAGMLSKDGRCKTLDASANGYMRGEAVGCLMLTRDERFVEMDLSSSAVRQDGKSASLTAPNGSAQRGLLVAALAFAGCAAAEVSTVQAHGTGTPLGDPTEMGSIIKVHGEPDRAPATVGAAKANVGHSEAASGQVGMLTVQRLLKDAEPAGNAKLRLLNPMVGDLLGEDAGRFVLPMQAGVDVKVKKVGLSAFGYSGTIAHGIFTRLASAPAARRKMGKWKREQKSFPWTSPKATKAAPAAAEEDSLDANAMRVPFLGALTRQSPQELTWENSLQKDLVFLQCHRVGKVPLLPGTCYIEMARNMAVAVHDAKAFTLANASFANILFLDDTDLDGAPTVRLTLDRSDSLVTISSRRENTAWTSHATLTLQLQAQKKMVSVDVPAIKSRSPEYVHGDGLYAGTANDYRGEFKAMAEAWGGNNTDAMGRVEYANYSSRDVHLRTCAWLDATTHAPIWWQDHQRRPFYVSSVKGYHVDSMDMSANKVSTCVQSLNSTLSRIDYIHPELPGRLYPPSAAWTYCLALTNLTALLRLPPDAPRSSGDW